MTLHDSNVASFSSSSKKHQPVSEIQLMDWEAPLVGSVRQIGEGIHWACLPLDSALGNVNVYLLEDGDGFTLVDTGSNADVCRSAWAKLLESAWFANRKIHRVIVTHYHPDHVGLAGWFAEMGVAIHTTRTCWLYTKTLLAENRLTPCEDQIRFVRAAGLSGVDMEAYCRRPPNRFCKDVVALPHSYVRIKDGDEISIGSRRWNVIVGHGHAAEQITLWSSDGYAITADQILPTMASNLSVYTGEPDEDVVTDWLESCHRLLRMSGSDPLCLPGHGPMFRGLGLRCQQLILSVQSALERLLIRLQRPATARDCLAVVYGRELRPHEKYALLAETMGFLTHLRLSGLVRREHLANGSTLWSRIATGGSEAINTAWLRRFDTASSIASPSAISSVTRSMNIRKDDNVSI